MAALESTHKKSLDRALKQIDAQAKKMKAEAIAKGGKDAVKLVEEIDEVAAEEKAKLVGENDDTPIQLTTLDKRFFAEHDWMIGDDSFGGDDEDEAEEAFALAQSTIKKVYEKTGDMMEAHERATKALRKAFPHRYQDDEDEDEERPARGKGKREEKPKRRAQDLAGGRRTMDDERGGGRSNLVSKLPPEAKRAAEDYVKRGIYGSVEEYAEVYHDELKKDRRA